MPSARAAGLRLLEVAQEADADVPAVAAVIAGVRSLEVDYVQGGSVVRSARFSWAPEASPESVAITAQRRARLWAAIDELPLVDRQIVALHLEGLSASEIEAVTGLSTGNVAVRLTRARRRLTAQVNGEET